MSFCRQATQEVFKSDRASGNRGSEGVCQFRFNYYHTKLDEFLLVNILDLINYRTDYV